MIRARKAESKVRTRVKRWSLNLAIASSSHLSLESSINLIQTSLLLLLISAEIYASLLYFKIPRRRILLDTLWSRLMEGWNKFETRLEFDLFSLACSLFKGSGYLSTYWFCSLQFLMHSYVDHRRTAWSFYVSTWLRDSFWKRLSFLVRKIDEPIT